MTDKTMDRREACRTALRWAALGGVGAFSVKLIGRSAAEGCRQASSCGECAGLADCTLPQAEEVKGSARRAEKFVWQLDPDKCMACGNCQTKCVLDESAVKCVQCFALCGYCDICTGYFVTDYRVLDTGAEEQLCPTAAITRQFVETQEGVRYFEYTIDESLCIGCGKCVKGCALMNGSLYLQVRHDRCVNCNECSIAVNCPTEAFQRVPASSPNLLRRVASRAEEALSRRRARPSTQSGNAEGAT